MRNNLIWPQFYFNFPFLPHNFAEKKDAIACEGKNITLKCPKDKPWMKITSATFGRTMSEARICPIPKNSSYKKWNSEQCSEDMTTKVAEICADQVPCVLNVNTVTFHDPCPHLYKYMWFLYECSKYQSIIQADISSRI